MATVVARAHARQTQVRTQGGDRCNESVAAASVEATTANDISV